MSWVIRFPPEWLCKRNGIVEGESGLAVGKTDLAIRHVAKSFGKRKAKYRKISVDVINTEITERLRESMGEVDWQCDS